MDNFATLEDIELLFRNLRFDERDKAEALLKTVSARLRSEAKRVGKDLDSMIEEDDDLKEVAKQVTVDVIGRALMTSTDSEPMTQYSESALGYSASGTYLVPGGGLFIKKSELALLGLRKQRYGALEIYD